MVSGPPTFCDTSTLDNSSESKPGKDASATVVEASSLPPDVSTSQNQVMCLFCNHLKKNNERGRRTLIFPKSDDTIKKIESAAKTCNDCELLSKLKNQTIAYHPTCYYLYQAEMKRHTKEYVVSSWHENRELHKLAFDSLVDYITSEIIDNDKIMYFSQLFSRYKALMLEFGGSQTSPKNLETYRPEYLEKKILSYFGDRITIESSVGRRRKRIVYLTDIDVSAALANSTNIYEEPEEKKIMDVAYYLRKCIQDINSKHLPKHLTADDVINGECDIPAMLFNFMNNLLVGPQNSLNTTRDNLVKVNSF